ncbi:MAG: hypothetical protein ACTTKN_06565 [Phocaeicola sp.]|uniref:hypothetical protein n=1 Tax=Phocaeicola TaxID=909656 RepID=UPI00234F81BC|nr:hypothetical protein [Phocaeicola oris]MCE2616105.1 hypothetical protein [Phocaeicola oris]
MDGLIDFLMFALPGGFIGSFFTWLVGRRKQDNDMLSQLQASINMLSSENRKILEENIQLRRENVDLKANQEEMIQKLSRLTKEVERLRKVISKQTGNEEKTNQRGNPRANDRYSRLKPNGVYHGDNNQDSSVAHTDGSDEKQHHHRSKRGTVGSEDAKDGGAIAESEDHLLDTGSDSGVENESGGAAAEPP